jgi:hypothetical protein
VIEGGGQEIEKASRVLLEYPSDARASEAKLGYAETGLAKKTTLHSGGSIHQNAMSLEGDSRA